MTKETNDILAEQLAVLSADIKPKVGKTARERAEGIASAHIRTEKTRLETAFAAWCAQGLLSKMAPEDAKVWHDYNSAVDAMIEYAKRVGPKEEYNNNARSLSANKVSFARFLTGEDSYYRADPKLIVMAEKVPGYAKKKASIDKRLAELDAIMVATKKAIWRTHREKGEITVSGIDIGKTVAAIIKQAIGVPAIAAPAIVPDVMPAEA
jgi:hypothetical protein